MLNFTSLQFARVKCRRTFVLATNSASLTTTASSSPSEAPSTVAASLADSVNALSRCQRRQSSGVRRRIFSDAVARASRVFVNSPSLPTGATGLFGIDELCSGPVGFARLQNEASDKVASLLNEALQPVESRRRSMVSILDDMSNTVCRVADMADCVRQLHPSAEYRTAAEEACVAIATLVESLNTNRPLYDALVVAVRDSGPLGDAARFRTDNVDKRVGELFIWDFLQSGVHLDASSGEADRFVSASRRAFLLGAEFSRNAMRPARGRIRGLPSTLTDAAGEHPDAGVRRDAYAAFYGEMPDQETLLCELLATRLEIAQIAGFDSYSDRATAGCLLNSSQNVEAFLAGLADRLESSAAIDGQLMRSCLGSQDNPTPTGAWDFAHVLNVATAACFQGDPAASQIDEFFSVGNCLSGLAYIVERLFNVQLRLIESNSLDDEVWDSRVFKLGVYRCHDNNGSVNNADLIGSIYCDFFPRPGKPAQDCHFTIRGGRSGPNPPHQLPIVCLQLQCPDPAPNAGPSLLAPGQVENLFHEFGHALHSVLGCTRYQHVTGTRCSTDLAEVPSTLMEMFAFQPAVLKHYARHWRTGEPLPQRLYSPLRTSRRVLPGVSRQQQTLYSMLDTALHSSSPPPSVECPTTTAVFNRLASRSSLRHLPMQPPGTAWHRFTHLIGYGAKYHAYLVSKAIASLVWSTRFAKDPLCSSAGKDYERRLLSRGGEESTVAMVTELTGRETTIGCLVDALANDGSG